MADTHTVTVKRSAGEPQPTFSKTNDGKQSSLCTDCQAIFEGEFLLGHRERQDGEDDESSYSGAYKLYGSGDPTISQGCHLCFLRDRKRIRDGFEFPADLVLRYLIVQGRTRGDFFSLVFSYSFMPPEEEMLDSAEAVVSHELSLSQMYKGEPIVPVEAPGLMESAMEYPVVTASNLTYSQFPPCQIETEENSTTFHRRQTLIDPEFWETYQSMVQSDPVFDSLSVNTNSPSTWAITRCWIKNCVERHELCQLTRNLGAQLPTRLVYVDKDRNIRPRIVEGSVLPENTCYTTLSHRWGTEKFLSLKSSNLKAFQKRLPDAALTPTFVDAMHATLCLGYQYIWIDSICILQDSVDDWSKESQKMGAYYSNSICNLAASKASNGSGSGLFAARDPFAAQSCSVKETWKNTSPQFTFHVHDLMTQFGENVYGCELGDRGWVFQETLLAPRVLYFGSDQIYWDCLCLRACEACPTQWIGLSYKNKIGQMPTYMLSEYCETNRLSDVLRWESVVEEYSSCDLTYPEKDRLVALSGIGRAFGSPADYLAGLWRDDIAKQLLWRPGQHVKRHAAYIAPSWSWASMNGSVTYGNIWDDHDLDEQAKLSYAGGLIRGRLWTAKRGIRDFLVGANLYRVRSITTPFVSLAGAQMQFAGEDMMGRVTGGSLRLKGFLFHLSAAKRRASYRLELISDEEHAKLPPIESLCFLPLRTQSKTTLSGLILEPTNKDLGEYRRIGFFNARDIDMKLRMESLKILHKLQHRLIPLRNGDYIEKTGTKKDSIAECIISII
ncbi:unnamed protein product [Clonostachys byssicola]|uniref:Heterokaryon incompatibility domain-containing protein n=1 Tax=Clonostachys byssicola TaxID=160290 RepID=A0A9N9XU40_9HYPO|nr:unnamed protein product [Clonostachys byssicola]